MIQRDRKWEHLLPPLSTSALLCLPETRVNRPTFCLCSTSGPTLRAASLQSLELPCRQFVFLPTQGFFPHAFFSASPFAKSTLLKQIQHKPAVWCIRGAKCSIFIISKYLAYSFGQISLITINKQGPCQNVWSPLLTLTLCGTETNVTRNQEQEVVPVVS